MEDRLVPERRSVQEMIRTIHILNSRENCPHKIHFRCFPNRKCPLAEHSRVVVSLVPEHRWVTLVLEDRWVGFRSARLWFRNGPIVNSTRRDLDKPRFQCFPPRRSPRAQDCYSEHRRCYTIHTTSSIRFCPHRYHFRDSPIHRFRRGCQCRHLLFRRGGHFSARCPCLLLRRKCVPEERKERRSRRKRVEVSLCACLVFGRKIELVARSV